MHNRRKQRAAVVLETLKVGPHIAHPELDHADVALSRGAPCAVGGSAWAPLSIRVPGNRQRAVQVEMGVAGLAHGLKQGQVAGRGRLFKRVSLIVQPCRHQIARAPLKTDRRGCPRKRLQRRRRAVKVASSLEHAQDQCTRLAPRLCPVQVPLKEHDPLRPASRTSRPHPPLRSSQSVLTIPLVHAPIQQQGPKIDLGRPLLLTLGRRRQSGEQWPTAGAKKRDSPRRDLNSQPLP